MSTGLNFGAIENLIIDPHISEIIINRYNLIFFEKNGGIFKNDKNFESENAYQNFIDDVCQACFSYINREKPFLETQYKNLRITLVFSEIGGSETLVCIRKKTLKLFDFNFLVQNQFLTVDQKNYLTDCLERNKNILVVGATGCGKTSLLQTCLNALTAHERVLIIEDTTELKPPNDLSCSLLCRVQVSELVREVSMNDLIKKALRLRPDRIVVGEIRGSEAKDLLLALSSGHKGSMGSLHAKSAHEALLRLEMLTQLGAPNWSPQSIKALISSSIDVVLVVERQKERRFLKSVFEMGTLESDFITLNQVF